MNTTYYWGSTSGTIFISTDSGATWNVLADTGGGNVYRVLIDPLNTNRMYCSVQSEGVFKSTNAGVNWSRITPNVFNGYDVEFKPDGSYSTIYASGDGVYLSTDSGATFTEQSGFSNGTK
jgi:photosystem II stability/assembly factor-like uncharacterized protein